MITPLIYKDQKVAVIGLGRSGQSVAHALKKGGAEVFAWDDQIDARKNAEDNGISILKPSSFEWEKIDQLILSPGVPHHYPAPHPLVARAQLEGLRPFGDMEILAKTQKDARYIGITGTNGKSTTTTLIGHILKQIGEKVEVGGNLGIPVLELNSLDKEGIYVLEVSSYQLETAPSLHFDVGILLNITPDHLDRHGGMEGYIEAKKLIYRNSTPKDKLVISIDDPHCLTICESLKALGKVGLIPVSTCKLLTEGISVKDGVLHEDQKPVLDLKVFDRLRGQHNWQNIAAAFGALRALGYEREVIAQGISTFPGLVHRQQVVAVYKNVTFVNDSKATNAEAVAKALSCYQGLPLYWLAGGRSKEGGITALKPYFKSLQHAFLFGESASNFALTLKGDVPYTQCETLKEAFEKAALMALGENKKDAVVLLSPACASFDQFRDFAARGDAFCGYVREFINLHDRD